MFVLNAVVKFKGGFDLKSHLIYTNLQYSTAEEVINMKAKFKTEVEAAQFITGAIKEFVRTSPLNCLPDDTEQPIFDEPLVQFAGGDDPLFSEYKTIIAPVHLTPREALAKSLEKSTLELPARFSVISWILPASSKIRQTNRRRKLIPSRQWIYLRWYGEKFNEALRRHVVQLLSDNGYLATAPMLQPYFKIEYDNLDKTGFYSNWSERHIAYAAGLGTFSLNDGLITERGIAHRCGSVVTDLLLPPSPRTAKGPYANCLFFTDTGCNACIARCPAGALSEKGHDKLKCRSRMRNDLAPYRDKYNVGVVGCGFCQTRVPCESRNPVKIKN